MADRKLINPPELFSPPGFSHVAVGTGQRLVCIAGQVALAPDFTILGTNDLGAQTRAAMQSIAVALEAVGAGWEHVVRRTIYTLAPTEFEVISGAIEEVTGSSEHPAQTIIGVTGLALPGLLIEIEATALID
jgi:enamine deaminase RidA (YjgF/YER057c/UK114 family)